jgi:hypothetical protein
MIPSNEQAAGYQRWGEEARADDLRHGWESIDHLAAETHAGKGLAYRPQGMERPVIGALCRQSRERMLDEAIRSINRGSYS